MIYKNFQKNILCVHERELEWISLEIIMVCNSSKTCFYLLRVHVQCGKSQRELSNKSALSSFLYSTNKNNWYGRLRCRSTPHTFKSYYTSEEIFIKNSYFI